MSAHTQSNSLHNTVDILGDKWTALIVDRLSKAPSCFCDVEKTLAGISPRTLSQRLDKLMSQGVIERQLYNKRPPRYNYILTPKGQELTSIVEAMALWGEKYN